MIKIKYFVMDVDGTLTDGKIYMSSFGETMKVFNIKDGLGIQEILTQSGIIPMIITGRTSDIVLNRCKELGIAEVYQGVRNKLQRLKDATENKLDEVAYIGDDINDLECMVAVKNAGGLTGCPADAVTKIKETADYVAFYNGGDGAVRDFVEWIVRKL